MYFDGGALHPDLSARFECELDSSMLHVCSVLAAIFLCGTAFSGSIVLCSINWAFCNWLCFSWHSCSGSIYIYIPVHPRLLVLWSGSWGTSRWYSFTSGACHCVAFHGNLFLFLFLRPQSLRCGVPTVLSFGSSTFYCLTACGNIFPGTQIKYLFLVRQFTGYLYHLELFCLEMVAFNTTAVCAMLSVATFFLCNKGHYLLCIKVEIRSAISPSVSCCLWCLPDDIQPCTKYVWCCGSEVEAVSPYGLDLLLYINRVFQIYTF